MFRLVDAHAHLEDVKGLESALKRAQDAGVAAVIAVGSDYDSSNFALQASQREGYELRIYSALGIHPWNLRQNTIEPTLNFIESRIGDAIAVGEVGLDYWYKEVRKDPEKKKIQQEVFEALLEIAKHHGKPAIIHSRGAWQESVDMTIKVGVKDAVFHWFTGPPEVLTMLLDRGLFISATPAAEYSKEHRRVIEKTPLDNLLLETDSPVSYQGFDAEPAHVVKALLAVAKLKGISENVVADRTTENASKIFGLRI